LKNNYVPQVGVGQQATPIYGTPKSNKIILLF